MQKSKIAPQGNEMKRVAETIGQFIEYWGFKSIHGRVWVLIYLSSRPLPTPRIVHALGVSKALVSQAISDLVEYSLIRADKKAEYGAQTYVAEENISEVIRVILRQRELVLMENALASLEALESLSSFELDQLGVSHQRLESIKRLTESSKSLLQLFLKQNLRSVPDWIRVVGAIHKFLYSGLKPFPQSQDKEPPFQKKEAK